MLEIKKLYIVLIYIFGLTYCIHSQILISDSARGNHWNVPSDNGTKTAFIKLSQSIKRYYNRINDVDLYIADLNGNNKQRIGSFMADSHDDVLFRWIDDSLFVCRPDITLGNINSMELKKISSIGPYPVSYNKKNKLILTGQYGYKNKRFADVWTVNPYTGKEAKILDASDFEQFNTRFDIAKTPFSKDPRNWRIFHRYFNPAGSLIWIKVTVPSDESKNAIEKDYGFTFDVKGKNIIFFGEGPAHPLWWDDEIIYNNQDGKLYYRDGTYTGNQVSGFCNHPALSSDRKFIVGDSDYDTNPVKLFLYKVGNIEPIAVLHHSPYPAPVWNLRYHINPSFSLHGRSIFYTMSTSENNVGYFRYDISEFLDTVNDSLLVKYDFDNDAGKPDGWDVFENDNEQIVTISDFPSRFDKSLFIQDASNNQSASVHKTLSKQSKKMEVSFDVTTTDSGSWQAFILKSRHENVIETYFLNKSICYRDDNGQDIPVASLSAMESNHLKYEIDVKKQQYNIYVNGLLKAEKIKFINNTNFVDQVIFKSGNQGMGGLYVDNIVVLKKNSSFNANKSVAWIEDFSEGRWLAKGDNGSTSWKTDIRNADKAKMSDFGVNDGTFMFFKTAETSRDDKFLVWKSELIDIKNKNVQISFKLKENENLENTDYVKAYYQVDGKKKQEFARILGNLPENNKWFTFKSERLFGKVLQIFIHSKTDGEKYFLDDVSVLEQAQ